MELPKLFVSSKAKGQIALAKANDYTCQGKVFRLQISGKGCDGFEYFTGFTQARLDDVVIKIPDMQNGEEISIHLDPFTAFYFREGEIDYLLDPLAEAEGFVVNNFQEEKYRGKFYKDESMVPKHLEL